MITKFPNHSMLSSEPLWISERPASLKTNHRSDYRGHFHTTKIPGPSCLIAKNKKFKVSAYLSTLPLSPPENVDSGTAGKRWLANIFESKEKKWRRGTSLQVSRDAFDVCSNYQLQFTPKLIENKTSHMPKHVPLKTMEEFNAISTYNSDYKTMTFKSEDICYSLQRRQPSDIITWTNQPDTTLAYLYHKRPELPPLESSTTYRTQFPAWSMATRYCRKPSLDNDKPLQHLPFDHESVYRAHYTDKTSGDRSQGEPIISSSGFLNREFRDNQPSALVPYIEYQRPFFYNVKDEL